MIIDTHCHYNMEPLVSTWLDHWHKAQSEGVTHSLVVGTQVETSQLAVELTKKELHFAAALAVHPIHVLDDINVQDEDQVLVRIETNHTVFKKMLTDPNLKPHIFAIGETGLDYFRLSKDATQAAFERRAQQRSLTAHLELAAAYQLPTILHVRDQQLPDQPTPNNAYWDTLIAVRHARQHGYNQPVIMHCVSGPLAYHQEMLRLNAYVGVAGNVTYPSANAIRELVQNTPKDKILLETDAPFLPPQKFRGQTCEPWMIKHTHDFLAEELKIESQQILENTQQLFAFR